MAHLHGGAHVACMIHGVLTVDELLRPLNEERQTVQSQQAEHA